MYSYKRINGRSWWCQEPPAHAFKLIGMIIRTWKFAANLITYNTIIHPPLPTFSWNRIVLVLPFSCTILQYQLLLCKRKFVNTFQDNYHNTKIIVILTEPYHFCINRLNYLLFYCMTLLLAICERQLRFIRWLGFLKNIYQYIFLL